MTTEREQQRLDLLHILYCASKTLDQYEGDEAGRGRCPLYPQKRTLELSREMSALCQ